MISRGNSSASDSSRGKSPRPISHPNMNHKIHDLDKRFRRVSLSKDLTKRYSATDVDMTDTTASGRAAVSNHAQAMKQIKSNLFSTKNMTPTHQQYVVVLMKELKVDQDTAVRAVRDTNGRSFEAARETLIRLLSKKMQQENQITQERRPQPQQQVMPQNLHPNYTQQDNQPVLLRRPIYNSRESVSSLPQRGSPDGASSRADSPPVVNGFRMVPVAPGYEANKPAQAKPTYDQNYNQYPRQFTPDNLGYDPRKPPTTSPPSYPIGITTNRNSGSFSPQSSDVGIQNQLYNREIPTPRYLPNTMTDRISLPLSDENYGETGVRQGHVQQIIQQMSPSDQTLPSGGIKNEVEVIVGNPHQPIIKGSCQNSPFYNNQSGLTPRLPPSYNTAQRFKKMNVQSNYPSNPASNIGFQPNEAMKPPNNQLDTPSSAINSALMGNIQPSPYHSPPCYPMSHIGDDQHRGYSTASSEDSRQHSISSQSTHASSSGIKPNRTSPMPQYTDSNNKEQYNYQAKNVYSPRRDPPPYTGQSQESQPPTPPMRDDSSRQVCSEISRARKSSTKPRGGKPAVNSTVADNYLKSVDGSQSDKATVVMRRPKEKAEPAVIAARVTASNKRHSGSYSQAPVPKQRNSGEPGFQAGDCGEKMISTSPVPLRKSLKKKKKNKPDEDSDTDSCEDDPSVVEEQEWDVTSTSDDLPEITCKTRRMKKYSPEAFKFYMEQHVENVIKGCKDRTSRRQQLEDEMVKFHLPDDEKLEMRKMLFRKESNYIRLKRAKLDLSMFQMVKKIGVGAFGEVMLARNTQSNSLYAIKFLKKKDVLKRNQVAHVKAERDILAEADNDWVVRLYYTFQDKQNLYFVMDFIPGGDMMSLLIRKGIFDEELARFYCAELTLALESVHKMGFIHRDIKPDNILIDGDGHIKLTDFGLCTGFRWTHDSKYYQRDGHARQDSMDMSQDWSDVPSKPLARRRARDANRHIARSLVGTPNYIAPEVLLREGYTQLCDWWSVGVILYEMVVGSPPFHSDTPSETQMKVIDFKRSLRIPPDARLEPDTVDFIRRLCCGQRERLGCYGGAAEVKQHPYYRGINWHSLRRVKAPYIPEIKFSEDTSNFDPPPCGGSSTLNLGKDKYGTLNNGTLRLGPGEHAFFEFTFRRFFDENGRQQSSAPKGYYDNFDADGNPQRGGTSSDPMYV